MWRIPCNTVQIFTFHALTNDDDTKHVCSSSAGLGRAPARTRIDRRTRRSSFLTMTVIDDILPGRIQS
jgi:hypothetical protein